MAIQRAPKSKWNVRAINRKGLGDVQQFSATSSSVWIEKISNSLAKDACVMSVDSELKDLSIMMAVKSEEKFCLERLLIKLKTVKR